MPDFFPSWGEYKNYVKLLIKTNSIDNAKKIWWDIRPHPFFNTIEFRVCDIPMRVDETIALAALIQATVVKLYKLHESNQGFRLYVRELLDAVGKSRVPCMSIMNMPPLPYVKRIPGLDYEALKPAYTDPSVWDSISIRRRSP